MVTRSDALKLKEFSSEFSAKPFVSLRWQLAAFLCVTSMLATSFLVFWAYLESESDIQQAIRNKQRLIQTELRIFSQQGFQLLEQRSGQIEDTISLASSRGVNFRSEDFQKESQAWHTLTSILFAQNASIMGSPTLHLAGPPPPLDPNASEWLELLFDSGGQFSRWFCNGQCELQLFTLIEQSTGNLVLLQRLPFKPTLQRVDQTNNSRLWIVAGYDKEDKILSGTSELPPHLRALDLAIPSQPQYLRIDIDGEPNAIWRFSLRNDGIPASIWVAYPLTGAIASARQNWQHAVIYIITTLFLTSLIALILLWAPLRRLHHLARIIPQLMDESSETEIKVAVREPNLVRDESHLFTHSALELHRKMKSKNRHIQQQTDELKRLAQYDPLTGLYNRSMFEQALHQSVIQLERHLSSLAIMFIDLNKFKQVNDSLGHDQGDIMLKAVAVRLSAAIRRADVLARFGGDEFVILLPNMSDLDQIKNLSNKLFASVGQPLVLKDQTIYPQMSIGVSLCTKADYSISQLMREADSAMYDAKHSGDNQMRLYQRRLRKKDAWKSSLESDLNTALDNNELDLAVSPLVNLQTGLVDSYVLDTCWEHPSRGLIHSENFLPQLEKMQSSILQKLSSWQLEAALDLIDLTLEKGAHQQRFYISMSRHDLEFPILFELITRHCQQVPELAQHLGIEVNEQIFAEFYSQTHSELMLLNELGVALSFTQFGVDLGSLNYLRELPLAMVRLDGSYTNTEQLENGMTKSLIDMMHKLKIKVAADHVDTSEKRALLVAAGCDLAQGRAMTSPLTVEQTISKFISSSAASPVKV
ncbi:putative bifunctional diguanylate cyclase/phosphodiesterase [Echinimonas agarilytica]|uniref:Diguanylate cyclase n=1 Tax=Echinimonas agarilytica TaxID=1215918 RepID=A0AA41W4D5_9GAMM|nr:diguanylate cyclase [Echinimonas agarilytica]MCM2678404.1 diguanylate cyclase [Echinimonas agarilytica]